MHSDHQMREVRIHEDICDYELYSNSRNIKLKIIEILLIIFIIILLIYLYFFWKVQSNQNYYFNRKLQKHYDYLLVGAGLFNAVLAEHLTREGKSVLVIEKRNHIGGNCYTEKKYDVDVHVYGPHIFRTSNKTIWEYVNQFGEFKNVNYTPFTLYDDELYSYPFDMYILYRLFKTKNPKKVKKIIEKEIINENITNITNLEEKVISIFGRTIYEELIKEYIEKQWEKDCKELDPNLYRNISLIFSYNKNSNYYNDTYQAIPIDGYTNIIKKMYENANIIYNVDFLNEKEKWENMADKIFFSGCIDEYYNYKYGELEYRNLRFVEKIIDGENYQGTAVVNYLCKNYSYTRIIEHKHLIGKESNSTVIFEEYYDESKKGMVPYYPINNKKNNDLYEKYKNITNKKVQFVGRLGTFKYLKMDETIFEAFKVIESMDF